MSLYKKIKYPALLLCSVCLCLGAFASTTALTALDQETEDGQPKRARIALPASSGAPTLPDVQERLMVKVQVLKNELPKAQHALRTIEETLTIKARSLLSTDLRRATELAGLVSTMKVLSGSLHNTVFFASKDRNDDNAWITVAMAVIGSGALKEGLMAFTAILREKEDTQDIDCTVLRDVSASIHEITKDIADPLQEITA
jgi:hypothetical protein